MPITLSDQFLSVGIWSQDHEKLAKWYEDILGFPYKARTDLPNDSCIEFQFGNNFFFIGKHDQVKENSKDPFRMMIGFNVPSVTQAYQELKKSNVTIIAPPFEGPPGGFWCMTIADPEGNVLQFYGDK